VYKPKHVALKQYNTLKHVAVTTLFIFMTKGCPKKKIIVYSHLFTFQRIFKLQLPYPLFLSQEHGIPVYFTGQITSKSKSPNPSRATLVRCSLCELNWISYKKHPFLTSSCLQTSCFPLVPFSFNNLLYLQFADKRSFTPVDNISL
jgi:hypothetical protein